MLWVILTEPAFFRQHRGKNGIYYKVGEKRLEVRDTKVENDNFYLLTLASAAKELNRHGMRNSNVLLSVGLSLTRFGAEKQYYPDEAECTIIPQGLIRCMREINEQCVRKIGKELDETIKQEIMAGGKSKVPEPTWRL